MKLRPEQQSEAVAVIKALPIFAGCTEAQLAQIAALLEPASFKKNKVILMEKELSRTLYVLAKGRVSVGRYKGGEKHPIAVLEAPNFFGEGSMLSDAPANAVVKTQEDSQLYTLTRSDFDAIAAKDPTFGLRIEKNMEDVEAQRSTPPKN